MTIIFIAVVLVISIGLISLVLTATGSGSKQDNSKLAGFVNHPDCFVRVTDKTNYTALEAGSQVYKTAAEIAEYTKNNLEMRIYDIRSSLYNFPEKLLKEYAELLEHPNDIHELFCVMDANDPESLEPAYIYKGGSDKGAELDDIGVCSFGFNANSVNAFMKLGILHPDNEQAKIKFYSDEMNVNELLGLAKDNSITLIGSNKEELFQDAYNKGLLAKVQTTGRPPSAFRITENYFPMEKAFFEIYCADIAKNIKGANKLYVDYIINLACKVNIFKKTRPTNRLTNMLQQLKMPNI